MENGKAEAAGSEGTHEAPPTDNFSARLESELVKWRAEGCPRWDKGDETDRAGTPCGARPHKTKIEPADADGNVTMHIDCTAGHEDVWQFKVAETDMKAELKRQALAAADANANGGKTLDVTKARVTITLDLKTQDVTIDPWVPTPGVGLQLAAMLNIYFAQQIADGMRKKAAAAAPKIKTPSKALVHPTSGKLIS